MKDSTRSLVYRLPDRAQKLDIEQDYRTNSDRYIRQTPYPGTLGAWRFFLLASPLA
jgi:hypothetical protein